MPIHLESHPEAIDLTPGTTKSDIVVFLYRNATDGYRPTELADTLDIPDGTATTTLSRLYADGLVGKTAEGHYHALEDRDDVHRYVASHAQLDRLFGHHRREHEPTAEAPPAVADDELATELDALDAGGDG